MPDPPTAERARADDEQAELLAFLRGRDVPCPSCRYNLRDLTRAECPECRQALVLGVGLRDPRIGWFLATLAPCLFSGMAAALLLVPMVMVPATGGGPPPPFIILTDIFGWMSGIVAVVLIVRRHAFMRQPPVQQAWWAVSTWMIHLAWLTVLVGLIFL